MPLFGRPKYTLVKIKKKDIPHGIWTKCDGCSQPIYNKELKDNHKVCPKCNFHFTLTAKERIELLIDKNTFIESHANIEAADPLNFKGPKSYKDKIEQDKNNTNLNEAVITGEGELHKNRVALAVTDSHFIMGTMGSVVGEKITRTTEYATQNKLPLIIVSGSGGGARMYEGMFSLMQMAKTSAALARHHQANLLFLSILTNPTMAGVMASFAGLGDIIIAEPKALIGFTGPRVIEQTIKQKLPEGFQRSEFMLEHGLIDMIIHRRQLKDTIYSLIDYLG